jgi:rubrerythrin
MARLEDRDMTKLDTVNGILDFAIAGEEESAAFYRGLAAKVDQAWMKKIFEGFAKEEDGHKAKLLAVKDGRKLERAAEKVADLKIGDYMVDVDVSDPASLDYQQALIIAMKKEKAAFRLYSDLAEKTEDAALGDVLLGLAQEEAKHKLRFEVEYDQFILTEN